MNPPTYGSPLLDYAQKLLIERPSNVLIKDLAAELGVTPVWLSGFARGRMPKPSAVIIEKIVVRLSGKQLVNHVSERPE